MTALALIRIAHIGSCAVAFGLLAFQLFVAQPMERPERAARVAMVIALASWLAWLAVLASQMSGQPLGQALHPDVLATVLDQTTFGRVWLIRFGLFVLTGLVLFRSWPDRERARAWLATGAVLSAGTLCSIAWTGHALGAHAAHAFIDAAHLLAAGLWLGMLVPLLWMTARALASTQPGSRRNAAVAARRFTVPGIVAVVTLAASGVLNAWWLVGSWSALVTTGYGWLVTAKIACFASMLVLASTNRWILVPRIHALLRSGTDPIQPLRWLLCSVACELALGAAVLALAGILGITPPAAHEHLGHAMHHLM